MHGVESKILIASYLCDDIQRLLAGHGVRIACHRIHVYAHGLNQILQIVETLVVAVGYIADEPCGHFHGLGEVADCIKPTCAGHRVADHRVHAGQCLRIQ